MALNNYILNGPQTVILYDNRDVTTSWNRHIRTTGRGGVDLVAPYGTPVYAPTPGRMFWMLPDGRMNGSAGHSCLFRHDLNLGWSDVFSHLSRYAKASGTHFEQGDIVGYSGDSGAPGQPHLHRHLLDPLGVRRNPWLHFTPAAPAGGGGTPLPQTKDNEMIRVSSPGRGTYLLGPGHVYKLETDEFRLFAGSIAPTLITGNDRQVDLWIAMSRNNVAVPAVWDAVLTHSSGITAPASGWLLNTSDMVGQLLSDDRLEKLARRVIELLPPSSGGVVVPPPTSEEIAVAVKAAISGMTLS